MASALNFIDGTVLKSIKYKSGVAIEERSGGLKCKNISYSSFSGTAFIIIDIFSSVKILVSIFKNASLNVNELIFNLEITNSTFLQRSACN